MSGSAVEDALGSALAESALDLLEEALVTGAFAGALLVTDKDALASRLPAGVDLDLDNGPFHFGQRLAQVVRERQIERPFYAGAGGVPLLRGSDLAAIAHRLAEGKRHHREQLLLRRPDRVRPARARRIDLRDGQLPAAAATDRRLSANRCRAQRDAVQHRFVPTWRCSSCAVAYRLTKFLAAFERARSPTVS
jgi:hypothetical protein